MAGIYQNIGHIILMLLLLAGSAFFSGVETAFFNLSRRQISLLQASRHKTHKLAASIINKPRQLLSGVLFGNMMVNVLFYASASVLTVRFERQYGVTAAVLTACLAFVLLVLFGEILPKSVAYANSRTLSIAAAVPLYLCLKVLTPVVLMFRILIVEPSLRLLLTTSRQPKAITTTEFQSLIEATRKSGEITADEDKLFTRVAELGVLKVRDCLRPRVDMPACSVTDSVRAACEIMQRNSLTKLPVYLRNIDNVVGVVHFRDVLLQPEKTLDKLVRKANFVPEQKTAESLLEFFRNSHTDTAVAVDEYGGIAGLVCLEDIAEEVIGPIEPAEEIEPVEQTGPLEYRLAGYLSIHELAQSFGLKTTESRFSTVGGLVTALLGRIPRQGDVAQLKNLKFTVEEVHKHRIKTVILKLEPVQSHDF